MKGFRGTNYRSFRGFTLIELLVVIAIIALLLSILMPSLQKVKEQAKLVVCSSNQHQILTGVHVYAAGNEGNLPPHVAMNKEGDSSWWDFPNYLACHKPRPVGGSLGWIFGDILPEVNIWLCPFSIIKDDTELEGNNGESHTYQEIYANPDPDNYTWVWMTMMPLWRYGGFADSSLAAGNSPAFKGPGIKPASIISADSRESTLAIGDFIAFRHSDSRWISSHPFKGSGRGGLFHEGPEGASKVDFAKQVGNVRYNCGFIDGRVERFTSSDIEEPGQYDGRDHTYFLPKSW